MYNSTEPVCVEEVTVGVALDGFPIKVNKMYSDPEYLDECGGREDDIGNYAYYFTDSWPYSLSCFRGNTVNLL